MNNSLLTTLNRLFSVGIVVLALASVVPVSTANAQGGGSYYGGQVQSTFTCSCGISTLITIDDYASGGNLDLIYTPGSSRIYDNNNVMKTGGYLVGSYSKSGQCMYYVGESCEEKESDGSMDSNPGTGTS